MNKLIIKQNTIPEQVNSKIIDALYNEAQGGGDVDLEGFVYVEHAKKSQVDYLNNNTNLYVNVTGEYYLEFIDPVMEQVIKNKFNITEGGVLESNITRFEITRSDFTDEQAQALTTTQDLKQFTKLANLDISSTGNVSDFPNLVNLWLYPFEEGYGNGYTFNWNWLGKQVRNRIYCKHEQIGFIPFRGFGQNPIDFYILHPCGRYNKGALPGYTFADANLGIVYVRDVDAINNSFSFSLFESLVIDNPIPPSFSVGNNYTQCKCTNIYVPDEAVEDYKTAMSENWPNDISKVKPISEMPTVSLEELGVTDIYDIPLDIQDQIQGKLIKEYREIPIVYKSK